MPKRNDISKVLIIGSGSNIIGQSGENSYSARQACKALRSLGYKIVVADSNPAAIITDTETADAVYIEPLNLSSLTEIIAVQRPDALLPTMGGQTALNLTTALSNAGVLENYCVKLIGLNIAAIESVQNHQAFRAMLKRLGIDAALGQVVDNLGDAQKAAETPGYPVMIRPAYTAGGIGSALAYNAEEFRAAAAHALSSGFIRQISVEESLSGWQELELEVIRDAKNHFITVCGIENIDPAGIHSGDSVCVIPMQSVSSDIQHRLEKTAYSIMKEANIIGCANIRFAHNLKTGRIVVISVNPRTSRSSAWASKVTKFPIAFVSTLLACGMTLDELSYAPKNDCVSVKMPVWEFEKFQSAKDRLGTQMQSVGEVISMAETYQQAFEKAVRSQILHDLSSVHSLPIRTGKKILLIGAGANRIGHGTESDYCCVHAAKVIQNMGCECVTVNCNPAAVSTDSDISDKLYIEPLAPEDILKIYQSEMPDRVMDLSAAPIKQEHFCQILRKLGIPQAQAMENAIEAEADALFDGSDMFIPVVMEHIERSGVHPGDSACVIPPISIAPKHLETMNDYAKKIASELGVIGLLHFRYAIAHDTVYVSDIALGAGRTVPLVSKVCNIPMIQLAVQIMLGKKIADLNLKPIVLPYFAVREAVFPFNIFPDIDPVLGDQMRSTGEVLGLSYSFGRAFFKAQEATGLPLPLNGAVLITVADHDKPSAIEPARLFRDLGFKISATKGTQQFLSEHGIEAGIIRKLGYGRPDITDIIKNGQVQLVINTPGGKQSKEDDSYIRKAAIKYNVPNITTTAAALAAAKGIAERRKAAPKIRSLQFYHAQIR